MSQQIISNIPEPILLLRTEVQNINQNKYSKRLQRTFPNHIQDPRLLISVDVKISSGDNISTKNTTAYTEVCKLSIPRHKWNLLNRWSGSPPEPYHVPRGKTIHAEYYSNKAMG